MFRSIPNRPCGLIGDQEWQDRSSGAQPRHNARVFGGAEVGDRAERSRTFGSNHLMQERVSLLQVGGGKSLGEPAADRSEKIARILTLSAAQPNTGKAHRRS